MPKAFGSTLTLVTFVLVVVVARFNSWDHVFFTFFKILGLGASISSVMVSIRIKAMVWVRFQA